MYNALDSTNLLRQSSVSLEKSANYSVLETQQFKFESWKDSTKSSDFSWMVAIRNIATEWMQRGLSYVSRLLNLQHWILHDSEQYMGAGARP